MQSLRKYILSPSKAGFERYQIFSIHSRPPFLSSLNTCLLSSIRTSAPLFAASLCHRRPSLRRWISNELRIYSGMQRRESSKKEPRNYYQILGVDPDASADTIRSAYHTRLFEAHPDHGGSPENFRLVREAYEALVFPDDSVLRELSDCVWANDTGKAAKLWEVLVPRMQQTKTLRFDGLFFDAVLYACKEDPHYQQLSKFVHDASAMRLFLDEDSLTMAYDSLLWHLKEGNRLGKCDIHLLFDCLDHMHTHRLPVMKDGWYSMHYWQG
mmetsp:Transcript_5221/g.12676  ORF Transcript_5221/g.12676 Transcript_5221/m.12676 type:complete len:269 (+) Transcript_5221:194-1000(+)